MDKNMKLEEGFTFITEANNLLIITKKLKNGKCYADEITERGVESVEYEYDESDRLIGKNTNIVYGVIDNTGEIIKNQTSFYFNKKLAISITNEMNKHISNQKKDYKVKMYYLIPK